MDGQTTTAQRNPYVLAVIGIVAFIALVAGGSFAMNQILVPVSPYTDTLPVHSGCTTVLSGESPYTENATLRTQALVSTYNPSYDPADDAHRFAYPAHHCIILLPLWLTPYDTGVPVWMFLNFIFFVMSPLIFLVLVMDYKVPIVQTIVLIMASLFFWRYSIITVIFAQYTGWILFCLMGVMWALKSEREIPLGLFLVGLTVRTGGAFFAVMILLYVLYERRWRVLGTFFAVMLVLWGITLALIGPWTLDFLDGLTQYTTYREDVSLFLPERLGLTGGAIFAIAMLIMGLGVMFQAGQKNREIFGLWGLGALILLELVFLPQTNDYTLVYALAPIFLVAYAFRQKSLWFYSMIGAIAFAPWLWSIWLTNFTEQRLDQLLIPAVVMVALVLSLRFGDTDLIQAENA